MKVEIQIDDTCEEPKVLIITNKITEEINSLVEKLSQDKKQSKESPQVLSGFRGDTLEILEQPDILRIYTSNGKVFAATAKGEYLLRQRLYELEDRLDKNQFVRISNSEIINLKKVKNFDLSFTGTICVSLLDGTITYVSRRYVTKIKQVLGV